MQSMLLPNEHLTCYIVTSRFCGVSIQMYVKTYGKFFFTARKKNTHSHYPIMAHHPRGTTVNIVGTEAPGNGRSCEEHAVCGSVLMEDSVVRIRCVQVVVDGLEESALACFWITDGIDRCRVGFLPRHYVKHWEEFEGRLAQIVEFYKDSDSPEKRRKNYQNSGYCKAGQC